MFLTIETDHPQANDLSYLLHKHPDKLQTFSQAFGQAHVFYPENSPQRSKVAVLLEIDPIGLVRRKGGPSGEGFSLDQYVNDRSYVASSFLSVTMADLFSTAMNGRCKDKPDQVETVFPFVAHLPALPCRGGEHFLRQLFEPLGYVVDAQSQLLDPAFPDWGASKCFNVTLRGSFRLQDLLRHLYVLIPVLDNDKHYWVGQDEVEKLLKRGEGWLPQHPLKDHIVNRYLKFQKRLTVSALEQLMGDTAEDPDELASAHNAQEQVIEETLSLNDQRMGTVLASLKGCGARRVLDLGCGEGNLLRLLLQETQFTEIVGMDVSHRVLEKAFDRLRIERLPEMQRNRIKLLHGSLMYRDERLQGFDAAALVEVIEHLDPPRLAALEKSVFEFAKPQTVMVTTPNVEFNVKFDTLPAGKFRHKDHRFEWTRAEFERWANRVATSNGYAVQFLPIGRVEPQLGSATQMALFALEAG
ncbi:MAG: 3' terminal RNA ribose 2'-O-methyltransferase Hen1 [Verrucomicrobiales bacterium]